MKPRPTKKQKETRRQSAVILVGTVPVRRLPSPLARRFNQICLSAMSEALRDVDLVPLQFAVLPHLFDEPGIDQSDLAARLGVDRTNVGVILEQLEKRGLIERRVSPGDRRVRQLYLTRSGDKLRESLVAPLYGVQSRILDAALTKAEAEVLLDLLVRVIQANERFARPGGGRRFKPKRQGATVDDQQSQE